MKKIHLFAVIVALPFLVQRATAQAPTSASAVDWQKKLTDAAPGSTVLLPAGTFKVHDIVLRPGVTVKGVGYARTILDAEGGDDGLVIRDGKGGGVSDLTVRGARRSAVLVENSMGVTVARVRLLDSLTGLTATGASATRVENTIASGNRTGLVLSRSANAAIVNCTLAGNTALGLSAAGNSGGAIFNNVVVNSPTGIYLGRSNAGLRLDYNLYLASFTGKKEGEVARKTVQSWRDISDQEAHSVSLPVAFKGEDDFRPVTPLSWMPIRATTSDWGVRELNKLVAPARDIDGNARQGGVDLGAYEVAFPAPRPADGRFKVQTEGGVKSAGLFTRDGTNTAWLFQNMPLARGEYPFWLPTRDAIGRPYVAGNYELRITESDLSLEYRGLAFNNGRSNDIRDHSSYTASKLVFDNKDRLILGQNWSENHLNVRAFDAEFGTARWEMQGSSMTRGVTTDEEGHFYSLRIYGKDMLGLVKLDGENGAILEVTPGKYNATFQNAFSEKADGIAALDGKLYVADPTQNKLYYTAAQAPVFDTAWNVPAPSSPQADRRNKLIWLISDGAKLLALDQAGTIRAEAAPVPGPIALSVNNGRLAVLSSVTGKAHIFDCSDPTTLKPLATIGRGDTPYGPFSPDRFLFKSTADANSAGRAARVDIALNSRGDVAVIDSFRVLFFAADGRLKRRNIAVWGQHLAGGRFAGDTQPRFFSIGGDYDITLDPKTGKWAPGAYYSTPASLTGRAPIGFFNDGGRNFGVYRGVIRVLEDGTEVYGDYAGPKKVVAQPMRLAVLRFDGYIAKEVASYHFDDRLKAVVEQRDTNGDGIIDARDARTPVPGADGKPLADLMGDARFVNLQSDGSLRMDFPADAKTAGYLVPRNGLDANGNPVYEWAKRRPLTMAFENGPTMTSPYDFRTPEALNGFVADLNFFGDGGYAATVALKTSGGMGLANNFGTDVAGFGPDGNLRWLHPLSWTGGVGGIQIVRDLVLTNRGTELEFIALDRDGLGLGVMGPRSEVNWKGMWIDHPEQFRAWAGNDGRINIVMGDYVLNAYHWFALNGEDKIRRSTVPVTITSAKSAALAALPIVTPARLQAPVSKVLVRKLAAPLPMDGDLVKWRRAGITPQILATPETASPDITGPADCSAVVRLAHEGGNLYVQVIKFDDVVTMHQPLQLHYKQDSTELAINSYMKGFKFNVTRTQDHGDTVFRDRFVGAKLDLLLDPEKAPRHIAVLDNARDVEERKLIEGIYGVDLSASKVIVTEWKMPLDYAFSGDPASGPGGKSGDTFWLGLFIDDNDVPGSDLQKYLSWPATYGTFEVKESGALATLE